MFYILIAVALFGALGFAVSNMMRSTAGGSVGAERASVYADDVLSYAHVIREATAALMISNNCSEAQISFERAPFDGSDEDYANIESPSDLSCHIFHSNGAASGRAKIIAEVLTRWMHPSCLVLPLRVKPRFSHTRIVKEHGTLSVWPTGPAHRRP